MSRNLNIILPISTRPFGFIIKYLCSRMHTLRQRLERCQLNAFSLALYRFTLQQLDIKLFHAWKECRSYPRIVSSQDFEDNFIYHKRRVSFLNLFLNLEAYFQDIVDLLDCVGLVKCGETLVIPSVPKSASDALDPCLVTIQNLRSYVERLSDYRTPVEKRTYFYKHSPLPLPEEAWTKEGDDNHPLLLNPDEVMPSDYNGESLFNDFQTIRCVIEGHNISDIPIFREKISYEGLVENFNILISSDMTNFVYEGRRSEKFIYKNLFGEIPRKTSVKNFAVYNLRRLCFCPYQYEQITRIKHVGDIFLNANCCRVKMPITTRGLGFIIENIVHRMHFKNVNHDINESNRERMKMMQALYRTSLLRLHRIIDTNFVYSYSHYNGFRFIENYLSCIPLECKPYKRIVFDFFVPARTTNPEYDFDPCLITYTNLREYCVALSNASTPHAVRKYFYDHSPIPGAIWEDVEDVGPILKNPDDIMPEKYDKMIQKDIETITSGIDTLYGQFYDSSDDSDDDNSYRNKQISKFLTNEIAGSKQLQNYANQMDFLLISSNIAPVSIESRESKSQDFWSPLHNVSPIAENLSSLYLFGEIPRADALLNFDDFLPRQPQCAKSFWDSDVNGFYFYLM